MTRPNLLFVFADQMRGMAMGCAGNPDVRTPHLDRLAAKGRRFTQAVATTPVCGPNRASMLTGLRPPRAGVPANDLPLKRGLPTLGTIARANGYQTGYIGKWHLDRLPRDGFTRPGEARFGFDHYWAASNCFHDYFTPRYFRDTEEMIRSEGYEPVVQTDLAIDFMTKADRSQPFALMLSWGPPHDPYWQVPDTYRAPYDASQLTLRPNVVTQVENPVAKGLDCRETHANYYAAITALDEQMGRLMSALDSLQLMENTLVIFTSDHGDMLWSHGLLKKQLPYQESILVPMIAHQPGTVPGGTVSHSLFGTIDLMPTLCRLLGWQNENAFDGENLAEAFFGPAQRRHPLLIANYAATGESTQQGIAEWRGIYTGESTYVESAPNRPWLHFDNVSDPYQLKNLVGSPEAQGAERSLREGLRQLLHLAGDNFLPLPKAITNWEIEEEWRRLSGPLYSPAMRKELQKSLKWLD